jgi:hypothetical protein
LLRIGCQLVNELLDSFEDASNSRVLGLSEQAPAQGVELFDVVLPFVWQR